MFWQQRALHIRILIGRRYCALTEQEMHTIASLPKQATTFTHEQWRMCYQALFLCRRFPRTPHESDADILCILQTLARYGGTLDLPFLSSWIDTIAFLWANNEGEIAEAAQECLPVLHTRWQCETAGKILLRPAQHGEIK